MGEEGLNVQEQSPVQVTASGTAAPATGALGTAAKAAAATSASTFPTVPVHWASSVATIIIDGLWSIPEMLAALSVVGLLIVPVLSILSGVCCLVAVLLLQRYMAKESWSAAGVKAVVIGVLAAIPIPFIGTLIGIFLLVWLAAARLSEAPAV